MRRNPDVPADRNGNKPLSNGLVTGESVLTHHPDCCHWRADLGCDCGHTTGEARNGMRSWSEKALAEWRRATGEWRSEMEKVTGTTVIQRCDRCGCATQHYSGVCEWFDKHDVAGAEVPS